MRYSYLNIVFGHLKRLFNVSLFDFESPLNIYLIGDNIKRQVSPASTSTSTCESNFSSDLVSMETSQSPESSAQIIFRRWRRSYGNASDVMRTIETRGGTLPYIGYIGMRRCEG